MCFCSSSQRVFLAFTDVCFSDLASCQQEALPGSPFHVPCVSPCPEIPPACPRLLIIAWCLVATCPSGHCRRSNDLDELTPKGIFPYPDPLCLKE